MNTEEIKKKAVESWENVTKQFKNGVNPQAYVMGFKDGYDAASTVPDTGEDAIEVLKDIMLKFGNAHDMLAKSKLTKEEYQPISNLLAKGKIELFNFYQLYRKQSKQ